MLEPTNGTTNWIKLENSPMKMSIENEIPQTTADLLPGKITKAKLLSAYQIRPTLKALATIKTCMTKKTQVICFITICKKSKETLQIRFIFPKFNITQASEISIT